MFCYWGQSKSFKIGKSETSDVVLASILLNVPLKKIWEKSGNKKIGPFPSGLLF